MRREWKGECESTNSLKYLKKHNRVGRGFSFWEGFFLMIYIHIYIYIFTYTYIWVFYIFFNGVLFIHGIQTHPPFEKEFLNSTEEFGGSVSIEAGDARHFGVGVYPYIYIWPITLSSLYSWVV